MMDKVPDAPYIVEAETKGMPPYGEDGFDYSMVESEFNEAKFHINQAIRFLIRAADVAVKYGKEKPIDGLIDRLDDSFGCEMEKVIKKLKEDG